MFVDIKEPNHLGETFHYSLFCRSINFELEKLTPAHVNILCA